MSNLSIYEVECLCGEKVSHLGKHATCGECGREIVIESWQVRHTRLANGLVTALPNSPIPAVSKKANP
jgi:hypothetical protein